MSILKTYGPHSICAWHEEWDALPADERARKKARQGVPYIIAEEMRVVDDAMQDVPPDAETLGEVIMRGNNVMRGYYNQPEATAEAFRGGWFHSGDLAVMHPDGYVELRDRKRTSSSVAARIFLLLCGNTIYRHPAVQKSPWSLSRTALGEVPSLCGAQTGHAARRGHHRLLPSAHGAF